ncbi:MAG: hypothetical protein AABX47_10540 [Nanoarchaeota archaeon]
MALDVPLYGPHWFNGIDTAFDIISIFAALMVAWYARKIKCITGDKSCCALGHAFILIAISFAIKVLTNIAVYTKLGDLSKPFILAEVIQVQILFALGYFFYRLFFLVALIWLVCIGLKVIDWRVKMLFVLFAAVATFFSHYSYLVFHLTAMILLVYVVADKYGTYKQSRNRRSAIIALSFFAVLLSQVMFVFVSLEPWMYVIGETLQVIGFLGIIYNQVTLPKAECCYVSSVPDGSAGSANVRWRSNGYSGRK